MSTPGTIRILLTVEESLVRTALRTLLSSWPGFEVVGEAATKNDALQLIHHLKPSVVLLSFIVDEQINLQTVHELATASSESRLVVLMGEAEPRFRVETVRQGARGVVLRKKAAGELRKAIEKIHETDEIWLDRASLTSLLTKIAPAVEPVVEPNVDANLSLLTEREREVLDLVVQGLRNKEIGGRLFISDITVRHHLTTIFNKLGRSNRFELIASLHGHKNRKSRTA
jgi:DNA-binding NarL/FixJ family response regulator